jgi:uncharacterized protein YndB with AHSA1/START domain
MSKTQITVEPGTSHIVITREFQAGRDLVFRAYTDPELLVQWLGPRELTMTVDEYDVRDGGRWRYIHTDPEGNAHGFHGVFHGTPSPEKIVQTFEYEGTPGKVALDSYTFEDHEGGTLVTSVTTFQSVEDRDAMVASGMERGVHDSYERLGELLARQGGSA